MIVGMTWLRPCSDESPDVIPVSTHPLSTCVDDVAAVTVTLSNRRRDDSGRADDEKICTDAADVQARDHRRGV